MDKEAGQHDHIGRVVWGAFILVLGLWWLLGEAGLVSFSWSYAGPVALIAVGVSMVLSRHRRYCC